jgi:Lar family restriction alleviation protein
MSEAIKPCLFCGKEPTVIERTETYIYKTAYRVKCFRCEIHPKTPLYNDKRDAIAAWNTRKGGNENADSLSETLKN